MVRQSFVRPARRRRTLRLCLVALAAALTPVPAHAQFAGFGVRVGVVASTTLAEDQVANSTLALALGGGVGPVRAVTAPAFQVEAGVSMPLRPRTILDLAVGWTAAGIDAKDEAGTRDLQDAGIGHATVSVRYRLTSRVHGGCGVGVIRYFAEERGLFASGTELSPLVECGTQLWVAGRPGRRVAFRLAGQMHRFRTPALVDAGARTGTVFRLAVQAGLDSGAVTR